MTTDFVFAALLAVFFGPRLHGERSQPRPGRFRQSHLDGEQRRDECAGGLPRHGLESRGPRARRHAQRQRAQLHRTGLTNGVTYYFWIKARQSSDNVWVNSNAASAMPMAGSGGNTYHWPLTGNLGTHDPTLINENGTWWEFQTGAGIYGKVSRNGGLQWDPLPSVLPNGLSWWRTYVPNQAGIDVWAPDVKVYNGRTYMYYSVSTFGSKVSLIGLISASSIATGDWRDDGLVIRTTASNDYNAIDPDLTIDANGAPWLSFGSWNSGSSSRDSAAT